MESLEELLDAPDKLSGRTLLDIQALVGIPMGWKAEKLGKGSHKGEGWVLREYNDLETPTGRMLRWHPGGGLHGPAPYWRCTNYHTKSGVIPAG